jgi:GTP cyclohydrolase III
MSSNFECLVKYNSYNYMICINNNINSIQLKHIFDKIKQMIENAVKESISFETHLFEVFFYLIIYQIIIEFELIIN